MNHKIIILISLFSINNLFAQSQQGELIKILLAPVNDSYNYEVEERVDFKVAIYKYGKLVKNAFVKYTIAEEQMDTKIKSKILLPSGEGIIQGISMSKPGFLRLNLEYEYNGKIFSNTATAGIEVEKIKTFTKMPHDFDAFWKKAIQESREIPLNPVFERMPELDNQNNIAYHIRFNHVKDTYIYGILTMPRKNGKFPAVLHLPGAGVYSYTGADVQDNVISLQIGIHGIPVNLYESDIYKNLSNGALKKYYWNRMDDRDEYYYNRVYTACVRAIDFLFTVEQFDGENIGVFGKSQGGALSIITAALDERVTALASFYPALSDLDAFKNGRAGGWPRKFEKGFDFSTKKREVAQYYDVVNFARRLKTPGFYSYGYNDNICPASSIVAMLNEVQTVKDITISYDAAHWSYPEIQQKGKEWLFNRLKVSGYK